MDNNPKIDGLTKSMKYANTRKPEPVKNGTAGEDDVSHTFNYSISFCGFTIIVLFQNPTAVLRKREKISVAKEKRAAKTIAVIIFVFSFCWLPFFCAYVILPFCDTCSLHPKVYSLFLESNSSLGQSGLHMARIYKLFIKSFSLWNS